VAVLTSNRPAIALRRLVLRIPGARPLAARLLYAWDVVRPFPLPRYRSDTPWIGGDDPWRPFLPPTAQTLGAAAMSPETAAFVDGVLEKLTPSELNGAQRFYYHVGRERYGAHWRFADLLMGLRAAAALVPPSSYLEIGVWRGRSAAVVATTAPACDIYGFDLWLPEYAGAENPGPDFVRQELSAAGHRGKLVLVSGDSRRTLPPFLDQHPDLFFDLITIDGAKSLDAVASDFAHALPRLKVGGVLLSDDVAVFPLIRRVWNKVIARDARYERWEFSSRGFGVAAAVRCR
jgi:predicted O-methyltransferase YrrM